MRHRPQWRRVACGAAMLFAAAALATALAWNSIFEAVYNSQLALSPSSRSYREWVAPDVPLYLEIYLFNWTNPDDFPHQKPILAEVGPYRFREYRRHVNVSVYPNNGTIAYRTQRTWQFDEDTSEASLQDNITILNVIAASAAFRSRDWGFLKQKGLSLALAMFGHGMSVSKLAGELLFDGYEDPLIDLANSLPPSALGGAPKVDRFGLFYGRNNSIDTDGYMEVTSGSSSEIPGQIVRWDGHSSLPFYAGECAKMTGSAGEFMPHNLTESEPLTIFMSDLCRTVYMDYQESGTLEGIPYHKYVMNEATFDNSSSTDRNSCFCNGECLWSGVMNVSACRYGSPSFLSLPHFLHGDPDLLDKVEGLAPDPDLHTFYFAVEPRLGIPLDVSARFQYNVYLEPMPNIALYANVPKMLFPIFWVQQKVQVESKVLGELRIVRGVMDWGGTVCACAALAFAAILTVTSCCSSHCKKKDEIEKEKDEAELKLNPNNTS
ncbi:protein peste-like isoform X1 [Aricia agestis]|uniref:protein peste-like isoform X1 n=1 Tax=Aricia agestis TaxID=91739 RepID=UPI001C209369|nr:protein peste-like isoform X1 [Aricia agestis]XP_041984378.1 protein peste-like isoform X1 [Aricia agestis]